MNGCRLDVRRCNLPIRRLLSDWASSWAWRNCWNPGAITVRTAMMTAFLVPVLIEFAMTIAGNLRSATFAQSCSEGVKCDSNDRTSLVRDDPRWSTTAGVTSMQVVSSIYAKCDELEWLGSDSDSTRTLGRRGSWSYMPCGWFIKAGGFRRHRNPKAHSSPQLFVSIHRLHYLLHTTYYNNQRYMSLRCSLNLMIGTFQTTTGTACSSHDMLQVEKHPY